MSDPIKGTPWLCVQCGKTLGHISGGELVPDGVPSDKLRTSGPNLLVVCDDCGSQKVFYTADPVVKATYQLVDAISTVMAKRVVHLVSEGTLKSPNKQ